MSLALSYCCIDPVQNVLSIIIKALIIDINTKLNQSYNTKYISGAKKNIFKNLASVMCKNTTQQKIQFRENLDVTS